LISDAVGAIERNGQPVAQAIWFCLTPCLPRMSRDFTVARLDIAFRENQVGCLTYDSTFV
jgi:hypothetical protein